MSLRDESVTAAYLEHLGGRDLALLAAAAGIDPGQGDAGPVLLARRGGLDDLLSSRAVFDALFSPARADDPLLVGSPFFVFAIAVQRVTLHLASASYVSEWIGPGKRAPVFDVGELRAFMTDPWHRFFFAELLASYTHVASGSMLVPTRRGLRRRRFSELDPVRLAALLDAVSDAERPGVLRRLGDLALFLTGVFPDHVARRGFGPVDETRLLRARRAVPHRGGEVLGRPSGVFGDESAVSLLDQLGRRWYRAAYDLVPRPVAASVETIGDLAQHFGHARRILGLVTEQFLFPHRDRWFGVLGG